MKQIASSSMKSFDEVIRILRCYDSHVHFLATGLFDPSQSLKDLTNPQAISEVHFAPLHRRGDWWTGFGWDQFKFKEVRLPCWQDLGELGRVRALFLSRADGHAAWLSQKALELADLWKNRNEWVPELALLAEFDSEGWPTGIVYESLMYSIYARIPSLSMASKREAYLKSQKLFLDAKFSHIRDMECSSSHFETLVRLDEEGLLKLYVEENFNLEKLQDLESLILDAKYARAHCTKHLRVVGVKFYLDGALGSEGAWVTEAYPSSGKNGFCLWPREAIEEIVRRAWQANLAVAVHCLGDQASLHMLQLISENESLLTLKGSIHLEHAEILNERALSLMKQLQALDIKITCHIQPCHWLTDRKWLSSKQPKNWRHSFTIDQLASANVPFYFGSDSPIEASDLRSNVVALKDLKRVGIMPPAVSETKLIQRAHSHPDPQWGSECFSEFSLTELG